MRALLFSSRDGFMARDNDDDLSWIGPLDAAVAALLIAAGTGTVLCSPKVYDRMAGNAKISMVKLSRTPGMGCTTLPTGGLAHYSADFDLILGPTLLAEAMERKLISCIVMIMVPVELQTGIELQLNCADWHRDDIWIGPTLVTVLRR